ncbi:MAG: polyribonucleotide nucleotidyltransferase, partial [Chloroflexota bacterium]|nr:polyribonucleotide nucleotidyltransferase [Chloroflexota bacterium]
MLEERTFTAQLGEDTISLSTGKLAGQAGGAVVARCGETVLLATATMSRTPRTGINFFPLTVDFEERLYAAGRIPGSFFRREGRPSEQAILTCRLIDRPLRPLFPNDMRNDVQVIILTLSQGEEQHVDTLAVTAASAALTISDVPFAGPVAAVRVAYIDEQLVVNPTIPQMEISALDLRVAGSAEAIIMVEAGANELSETIMVDALQLAHESIQDLIRAQNEMHAELGKPKREYPIFALPEPLQARVHELVAGRVKEIVAATAARGERSANLDALENEMREQLAAEAEAAGWTTRQIGDAFHDIFKNAVRDRILDKGIRPDGRDSRTIRPLFSEVGLLPRTHGSGLFTRGETQALSL